jgi:tRNA threonylcarbamoyl adenosine modification protein YeaZ
VGGRVNVLVIETATPACAMGLATSDGREIVRVVDDERHHTEALAPGLRDLLRGAGLAPRDVDLVVVDRGPGLFTGLRVGIATAIGLSLATGAGLVGVTSLELLAHGAWRSGVRGPLVACVDGRRGEVFVQAFDLGSVPVARNAPAVARPAAVAATWAGAAVTLTGDGVARYGETFAMLDGASLFDQRVPPPLEALRLGPTRTATEEVAPLYLRDADAVANFSTRTRQP